MHLAFVPCQVQKQMKSQKCHKADHFCTKFIVKSYITYMSEKYIRLFTVFLNILDTENFQTWLAGLKLSFLPCSQGFKLRCAQKLGP